VISVIVEQVKLVARVSGVESGVDTCLTVDKTNNHVVLDEPGPQLTSCSQRQRSVTTGPKLFMFDQVFGPDDSLVGPISVKLITAEQAKTFSKLKAVSECQSHAKANQNNLPVSFEASFIQRMVLAWVTYEPQVQS